VGDPEEKGNHLHVLGREPDGSVAVERYLPDGTVQSGTLHAHQDGKPLGPSEEYVKVVPENGCYRCETIYRGEAAPRGPARVTSEEYREGWDAIWSKGSQAVN